MKVLAIDPGLDGALVVTDGATFIRVWKMPVQTFGGKERVITFDGIFQNLQRIKAEFGRIHVFLERAVSFGMGTKAAFNYGKGFATIEIALSRCGFPVTLVEPHKWAKEMHQGCPKDLKPKAKSLIAVQRLYKPLLKELPKKKTGVFLDGPIDALLIAGWGLRHLAPSEDFY